MRGLADVFHPSFRLASASLCLAYFLNTFVRRRALVTHRLGEVDQGRRAPFFRQVYFGLIMLTPRLLAAAALPVDAGAGEFASSLLATLSELPGLAAATWGVSRFGASAGTCKSKLRASAKFAQDGAPFSQVQSSPLRCLPIRARSSLAPCPPASPPSSARVGARGRRSPRCCSPSRRVSCSGGSSCSLT